MSETTEVLEWSPSGTNGGAEGRKITAPSFLRMVFAPLDRVAVQTLERSAGRVEPRMVSADGAALADAAPSDYGTR